MGNSAAKFTIIKSVIAKSSAELNKHVHLELQLAVYDLFLLLIWNLWKKLISLFTYLLKFVCTFQWNSSGDLITGISLVETFIIELANYVHLVLLYLYSSLTRKELTTRKWGSRKNEKKATRVWLIIKPMKIATETWWLD